MHGCEALKKLIDKLPNGSLKNDLLVVYNRHCGGVTTQDGGGGSDGPPPHN